MDTDSIVLNLAVLFVNLLMMISVGLSLELRHFLALAKIKFSVIGLLIAQTLLLPSLAVLIVSLLALPPHVKTGILLLAACPIGDIANYYVLLARANLAISVTLNSLSCALAAITMPLVFIGYHQVLGDALSYSLPYSQIGLRLALLTTVPLSIGMLLRRFSTRLANRLLSPMRWICTLGIVFVILQMFLTQRERLSAAWGPTVIAAALLLSSSMVVGIAFARILRLSSGKRFAGSITFPVRNIGLAIAVSVSLANHLAYASFAVIFFLVEVPLLLICVAYYRSVVQPVSEVTNDPTFAV